MRTLFAVAQVHEPSIIFIVRTAHAHSANAVVLGVDLRVLIVSAR